MLDLLDDPQFRGLDLAGIDDAEQTGVATPIPKTDFDLPGEEIPDDSSLGRLGSSEGAGSNALFTDTEDAVYFDTPNAALRRQLDISPNQLSLEDMVGAVDELEDGSHVNSVDDTVVTPPPTTPVQSPPVGDRLPVGFDRRGAMDRLGVPPKLIIFNGFLVGAKAQHCQARIRQRDRFATTRTIPSRNDCFGAARAASEWPARRAHSTACPNA